MPHTKQVWGILGIAFSKEKSMAEYKIELNGSDLSDIVNRAADIVKSTPIKEIVNETVSTVIGQSGLNDKVNSIISSEKLPNIDGAVAIPMSGEESCELLYEGDIIGIKRPLGYEHFAVYAGNRRVIHFASSDGDFGDPTIHEAPIADFLGGQQDYFVLDFSCAQVLLDGDTQTLPYDDLPRIYSAEETLERAKSVMHGNRYGFNKHYDLVSNNCEHFAIWCKTGQIRSYQVNRFISSIFGGK